MLERNIRCPVHATHIGQRDQVEELDRMADVKIIPSSGSFGAGKKMFVEFKVGSMSPVTMRFELGDLEEVVAEAQERASD